MNYIHHLKLHHCSTSFNESTVSIKEGWISIQNRYISKLLTELSPYKTKIIIGILLSVISIALGLIQPLVMKSIIDDAIPNKDTSLLLMFLALLIALPVGSAIIGACQTHFIQSIGQRVARDLRVRLYSQMVKTPMKRIVNTKPGDLVTRITSDCGEIEAFLSADFLPSFSNAIHMFGILAIMFVMDWRLTLLGLTIMPVSVLVTRWLGQKIKIVEEIRSIHHSEGGSFLHETIGNIKTIQTFRSERIETRNWRKWNDTDLKLWRRVEVLKGFVEQLAYRFLNAVGVALVLDMAVYEGITGSSESVNSPK